MHTLFYFDKVKNKTSQSVKVESEVKNVIKFLERIRAEYN